MTTNNQNNNNNTNPYLVTTKVDVNNLPSNQMNNDLAQIQKAERQTNYKANIAKGVKNPQLYRAMSALRLTNPFKGI